MAATTVDPRLRTAPPAGPPVVRRVEQLMGMPISLALRGPRALGADAEEAWCVVLAELRAVDAMFSTYRPDSVVSRLNRGELEVTDCPAEVRQVLHLGAVAERQSDGAFSVWLPGPDGRRRLDPSGVVKGWAVERAAGVLDELTGTDYCLSAGGDLVCRVADPARAAWRVGIEDPHEVSRLIATVEVRDGAVATSGAARRGRHILDPRSGTPASGAASVTVIGSSLTWADIEATAAYVHGLRAASWLRGRPGSTGLVVWPDGTSTIVG